MVNGRSMTLLAAIFALTSAVALPGGRFENREMPAPSLRQSDRDCRVYLPPSYDQPAAAHRRYPVIVFLHGWPGSEGNWPGQGHVGETLDRLIRSHAIPEVIGLFPDGGGSGHLGRSMWLDGAPGESQMETYLVHDLPRWADATFRTIPEARMRGVIGLSDGGTGAINAALRHPSVYGAAGSHSGVFRLQPDWSSGPLFEDGAAGDRRRAEYSALEYLPAFADSARRVTLYFDCGRDDDTFRDNVELDSLLTALRVPHEWHAFDGSHEWSYWRTHIEESLRAVTRGMRDE